MVADASTAAMTKGLRGSVSRLSECLPTGVALEDIPSTASAKRAFLVLLRLMSLCLPLTRFEDMLSLWGTRRPPMTARNWPLPRLPSVIAYNSSLMTAHGCIRSFNGSYHMARSGVICGWPWTQIPHISMEHAQGPRA